MMPFQPEIRKLYTVQYGVTSFDALIMTASTTTNELGVMNWTSRGAPNPSRFAGGENPSPENERDNFFRTASPHLSEQTDGPQSYITFFYGNNATDSPVGLDGTPETLPFITRWRPLIDFFNVGNLYGAGNGADAFEILSLKVVRMKTSAYTAQDTQSTEAQ